MTDTFIVCATSLLGLAILVGAWLYVQHKSWARAASLVERDDKNSQTVADLTARLARALDTFMSLTNALQGEVNESSAKTSSAVLALSERLATQEAALKGALVQIVQVVNFTEERYKQLLAASVRTGGGVKRPNSQG